MKRYSEEYQEKQQIAQKLRRYYKKEAQKNGLSSLDRVKAYVPGEYMFRALRRGFAFAHLGIEPIIESIARKKPFTVVSGLNPSSPLHLGHKALFDVLIDLQKLGADVQIPLTNDESYVDGKAETIEDSKQIALEKILPDISEFGFVPGKTNIYIVTETPMVYRFAMSISRFVTYDMVKAVFGKESLVNVGQIFYRGVVQLAQILLPQLPQFGGPKPTLIPVGIDQHPYVLLARDVAKKLCMIPPSELVVKFQPSLLDPEEKMSGSKPNTAIYLIDSEEVIRKKISRAYTGAVSSLADHRQYGGIPDMCPVFALLLNHHPDDAFVGKIRENYESGRITTSELKSITADFIVEMVKSLSQKRDKNGIIKKEKRDMSDRWTVVYYVSASGDIPVRDFFNSAGPALKAKALRILMHVEEYGLHAIISHVKKLSGTPIWEIRIMGGENVRVLFVTERAKQVLLLHAFYKKTQKTPSKEIATALNRLKDYERQYT